MVGSYAYHALIALDPVRVVVRRTTDFGLPGLVGGSWRRGSQVMVLCEWLTISLTAAWPGDDVPYVFFHVPAPSHLTISLSVLFVPVAP